MSAELTLRYDNNLHPVSAQCSACGQLMPDPPPEVIDAPDVILWFSGHFIEHKRRHHPTPPYGSASKD
ncbi:hypothetical protein [Occallatibacter savannae]|uniref:hypothetical protein n=1 Tax=Occallatibacter savannae TaxID=1002691 RepID=UPI0013A56DD8|nr:hypothetical protein [Occallatibacter savannae]